MQSSYACFLLPVAASTALAIGTNPAARPLDDTIESAVLDGIAAGGTPGAQLGIARGGNMLVQRGFGMANLETGTAMTAARNSGLNWRPGCDRARPAATRTVSSLPVIPPVPPGPGSVPSAGPNRVL
jgi:hypothetical protein